MAEEVVIGGGIGLVETIINALGGGAAVATALGNSISTILNFLGPTGFEAVQTLMRAFSNSQLYTLIGNIATAAENGYMQLQGGLNMLGSMTQADFLSKVGVISEKLMTKGIDIATNTGKQTFLNIVDQVRKMTPSTAFNVVGGTVGLAGGAYNLLKGKNTDSDHDVNQNANKTDYNFAKRGWGGGQSVMN